MSVPAEYLNARINKAEYQAFKRWKQAQDREANAELALNELSYPPPSSTLGRSSQHPSSDDNPRGRSTQIRRLASSEDRNRVSDQDERDERDSPPPRSRTNDIPVRGRYATPALPRSTPPAPPRSESRQPSAPKSRASHRHPTSPHRSHLLNPRDYSAPPGSASASRREDSAALRSSSLVPRLRQPSSPSLGDPAVSPTRDRIGRIRNPTPPSPPAASDSRWTPDPDHHQSCTSRDASPENHHSQSPSSRLARSSSPRASPPCESSPGDGPWPHSRDASQERPLPDSSDANEGELANSSESAGTASSEVFSPVNDPNPYDYPYDQTPTSYVKREKENGVRARGGRSKKTAIEQLGDRLTKFRYTCEHMHPFAIKHNILWFNPYSVEKAPLECYGIIPKPRELVGGPGRGDLPLHEAGGLRMDMDWWNTTRRVIKDGVGIHAPKGIEPGKKLTWRTFGASAQNKLYKHCYNTLPYLQHFRNQTGEDSWLIAGVAQQHLQGSPSLSVTKKVPPKTAADLAPTVENYENDYTTNAPPRASTTRASTSRAPGPRVSAPRDPSRAPGPGVSAPRDPSHVPAPRDPSRAPGPREPSRAPAPRDPSRAPGPRDPSRAPNAPGVSTVARGTATDHLRERDRIADHPRGRADPPQTITAPRVPAAGSSRPPAPATRPPPPPTPPQAEDDNESQYASHILDFPPDPTERQNRKADKKAAAEEAQNTSGSRASGSRVPKNAAQPQASVVKGKQRVDRAPVPAPPIAVHEQDESDDNEDAIRSFTTKVKAGLRKRLVIGSPEPETQTQTTSATSKKQGKGGKTTKAPVKASAKPSTKPSTKPSVKRKVNEGSEDEHPVPKKRGRPSTSSKRKVEEDVDEGKEETEQPPQKKQKPRPKIRPVPPPEPESEPEPENEPESSLPAREFSSDVLQITSSDSPAPDSSCAPIAISSSDPPSAGPSNTAWETTNGLRIVGKTTMKIARPSKPTAASDRKLCNRK